MRYTSPCTVDAMAIHITKRQAITAAILLTIGPITAGTYLAIVAWRNRKAKTMTLQEQKDLAIRIARKHERDRRNNPWSEPEVTERQPTDAEILATAGMSSHEYAAKHFPETPRERIRRRLWTPYCL